MAVTYQPEVIQQFAEKLYAQARGLMIMLGLLFGLGGLAAGIVAGQAISKSGSPAMAAAGFIVGALAGGIIGYARGFSLRLQAQQALCQLQIEINTRPAGTAASSKPASMAAHA